MRSVEISVSAVGIDCLTPLSPAMAKAAADFTIPGTRNKISFFTRYLENITASELAGLLDTGLGVRFVSESREPGWIPSAGLGGADGLRTATRAHTLGIPQTDLWCDLESPAGTDQALIDYSVAWCDAAKTMGLPRMYEGEGLSLSPGGLYMLPFTGYWRSTSNVQPVATADYMVYQLYDTQTWELSTGPLKVDIDFVCRDKRGRLPHMVIA